MNCIEFYEFFITVRYHKTILGGAPIFVFEYYYMKDNTLGLTYFIFSHT